MSLGIPLPDGMTYADYRNHPIVQLVRSSAAKNNLGIPSKGELDSLSIPPAARRQVMLACQAVASKFDEGLNQEARDEADEYSARILSGLDPEFRNPNYLRGADETATLGPGELAEYLATSDPNFEARRP